MSPLSIENSGIAGIASRHGYRVESLPQSLFDLDADISESRDVSQSHPSLVTELLKLAQGYRSELGDSLTKTQGTASRQPGVAREVARP
jgi:arylsulfatase